MTVVQGATAQEEAAKRQGVREAIRAGSRISPPFLVMNCLATIVACYGLLSNSTAVVIGAMLIAMLLGPITGMALAVVDGDGDLFVDSLGAEIGGALWVLVVAFVIGLLHRDMPVGSELLNRTAPNLLDIVIALAGGAAGAYAAASPKVSAGLVGAAIATALVPPLCTCSIFLARGEVSLAMGGLLLWFANMVAIQAASSVALFLLGYRGMLSKEETKTRNFLRVGLSLSILAVLTVALGAAFFQSLAVMKLKERVTARIQTGIQGKAGAFLSEVDMRRTKTGYTAYAITRTPSAFTPEEAAAIQADLPPEVKLHVRSVLTKDTTAEGYVFESKEAADAPD
jgi:uncharacterized hydrophobic protein (TIGR00271 family)